jgi:hypothetical protein
VPQDPFSQIERDYGLRPRLNLPGFRQFSDESLKVSVIFYQSVKDKTVDVTGGGVLGEDGIEKRSVSNGAHDQLIHELRGTGPYEDDIHPDQNEEENWKKKEEGLDLQGKFPFKNYYPLIYSVFPSCQT